MRLATSALVALGLLGACRRSAEPPRSVTASDSPPSPTTATDAEVSSVAPEPGSVAASASAPGGGSCVAQLGGSDHCFSSVSDACETLKCRSARCAYLYSGGRATTQVVCQDSE